MRKVAGSLTLVLQEHERGSFAIEATWTDYFSSETDALATPDQYISTQALLALCQMCKNVLR